MNHRHAHRVLQIALFSFNSVNNEFRNDDFSCSMCRLSVSDAAVSFLIITWPLKIIRSPAYVLYSTSLIEVQCFDLQPFPLIIALLANLEFFFDFVERTKTLQMTFARQWSRLSHRIHTEDLSWTTMIWICTKKPLVELLLKFHVIIAISGALTPFS